MLRPVVAVTICYMVGISVGRLWLVDHSRVVWMAGMLLLVAAVAVYRKIYPYLQRDCSWRWRPPGRPLLFCLRSCARRGAGLRRHPVYVEGTVVDEPLLYDDHIAYRLRVETVETKEGDSPCPAPCWCMFTARNEPYWFSERLRLRGAIVEPGACATPAALTTASTCAARVLCFNLPETDPG